MNPPAAPHDCRRCGVCCFSESPIYVPVSGDDWTRLGAEAEGRAHFLGNRAFMRMLDGHCAALQVRREPSGEADFFCAIYDERPQICRDLARGSPACAGELALKGARVREPELLPEVERVVPNALGQRRVL